jgi:hypothetical protein
MAALQYGMAALQYGMAALQYGMAAVKYGMAAVQYGMAALQYGMAALILNVYTGCEWSTSQLQTALSPSNEPWYPPNTVPEKVWTCQKRE